LFNNLADFPELTKVIINPGSFVPNRTNANWAEINLQLQEKWPSLPKTPAGHSNARSVQNSDLIDKAWPEAFGPWARNGF
jgi:hypothetical protein